jgi:trigger factor
MSEQTSKKSVIGRQEDGTIQITISIPQKLVQQERESSLKHMIENLEIPGFRKGKVPRDHALKHIEQQKLYEHILQHILPQVYTKAVEEHNLRPVLNPKFELISTDEGKDWSVRATTCELPKIEVGDYKKAVSAAGSASKIWVPGEGKEKPKEPTREEKEQKVIQTLVGTTKINIPKLLIDEEVNHRLAGLVDQLQKLGLTVEQYLASNGRKIEDLKEEYTKQAKDTLKLTLTLNKIAEEEKINVVEAEIEDVLKVSAQSATNGQKKSQNGQSPQQKQLVRSVLMRRKALDRLVGLI